MLDDGDRILDLVGVALVVGVLIGLGIVAIAVGAGPSGGDAPDAEWSLKRINDTHVRIAHAGGEAVPGTNLFVTVDSLRREANWSSVVSEGDGAAVRAGNGTLVRLYWDGGRGDKQVLARWRLR